MLLPGTYIGIDPGLTGAVAVLVVSPSAEPLLTVVDLPVVDRSGGAVKRAVCVKSLIDLLAYLAPPGARAALEHVHAAPGQGVAGVFSLGHSAGVCEAALAARGIPSTLVRPATWKAALCVPADKNGARERAAALLPFGARCWPRAKDHNRAEAALLAYYAAHLNA